MTGSRRHSLGNAGLGSASLILLMAASVLHLGCINWIEIRPQDLPRLSAASSAQLQEAIETGEEGGASPSSAVTGTTIEDVDGDEVRIRPPYDARIVTALGRLEVDGPVAAAIAEGALTVQGPQTRRSTVPLEDIEAVQVSQFATVKTYLLILGLTIGIAAGGLALIAID
ncbi:MAG: hypothetical protein ACI9KE_004314 [Polyangiales bacterium]|jgi:hypothetical protein